MVQEALNMMAKLKVNQTEDTNLRLGLDVKLSSINAMHNQLMETPKLPICQNEQERSFQSAIPTDKRLRRVIRKTQKAIEAAETEQLFVSAVKCNKRKAPLPLSAKPLPLSAKPARLVVRIPLKHWVEGKENRTPKNCIQECSFSIRNDVRDVEESEKEGDKTQSKLLCNPVREVDLTPSYCIMSVENTEPHATNQTDLERSVLNDTVRLVPRETKYHRKLNHIEEVVLHNEDVRFELDIMIAVVQATIKQVELWIDDIKCGLGKPMDSYFSARNRICIEKIYGDKGLEMVGMLQERPKAALPIVLTRLRQKVEEVDNYRTGFNHALKEVRPLL